jgi:mono/diheme cytochrome c family protein
MRLRAPIRSVCAGLLLLLVPLIANRSIAAMDDIAQGRALYLQYCASCHGVDAKGDGPIAGMLTTPPPNLRLLSERYGNPLPEDQIARFIDGRADVKAHGPRDMPVWGRRFSSITQGNQRMVKNAITKLVAFLQSIQSHVTHASASR